MIRSQLLERSHRPRWSPTPVFSSNPQILPKSPHSRLISILHPSMCMNASYVGMTKCVRAVPVFQFSWLAGSMAAWRQEPRDEQARQLDTWRKGTRSVSTFSFITNCAIALASFLLVLSASERIDIAVRERRQQTYT
jgi:hypothetical protein